MVFLVSTVSSDVPINDLGYIFSHPTVDRDLSVEISNWQISQSVNLAAAIAAGTLIVKISAAEGGLKTVSAAEYTPSLIFQADLADLPSGVITIKELAAGKNNVAILSSTFPVSLTSTSAGLKTISATTAKFIDWRIETGDSIYLSGTITTDGYFTVAGVVDQKNLTVAETIQTTASIGNLTIFHQPGASKIGVDNTGFTVATGTTAQTMLASIDGALAARQTVSAHSTVRQLIHFIDEGPAEGFATNAFREQLPSGNLFPTDIIWWESAAKIKKIVEQTIGYGSGLAKPTPIVWKVYATDGSTVIATITDTYTYSGIVEQSRVRTIV